jgi:hypothetical protein
MSKSTTLDTRADLRTVRHDILSMLTSRPPFPAALCSQWKEHWCQSRVKWYGAGGLAYCDACWRRLGFHQWYHDLPLDVDEHMALISTEQVCRQSDSASMPPWYDPALPDYADLVAYLKRTNGDDYDAAGEIAERRAAWEQEQQREAVLPC